MAGLIWLMLCFQAAVLGVLLFLGNGPRLFLEQPGWLVGMGLSGSEDPDGHLFVIHVASLFTLGLTLWMWRTMHPWLRRSLIATIVTQLLLAPLGLVVAGVLIWFLRRDDWEHAVETQRTFSGATLTHWAIAWTLASLVMCGIAIWAFVMLQHMIFLWPAALLLCGVPQTLVFLWANRDPRRVQQAIGSPLPPLPDRDAS